MSGGPEVAPAVTWQRFKPYREYRDSGVEWLGEIPAHWELKRLRHAARLNPPASEVRGMDAGTEVSFVPMEAVGEYGGLDLTRSRRFADIGPGYTYFRDGDVVVAKITPCFENGKGALASGLANGVAFGTTELHVFRPSATITSPYLFYVTSSNAFRHLGGGDMYGAGGQKRVSEAFFQNLRHPLPPLEDQRLIAAFLDRETARIDTLVAKKERLIELLQEQRTALINRAVTKGLDPNVPMVDSGVEWLGDMPASWASRRLRFLLRAPLKYGANEPAELADPDLPRYVRITDIDENGGLRTDTFRSLPREVAEDYLLREGDVLFARSGATVGKTFLYRESWGECAYAGYLIRARLDTRKAIPEYVTYFTASSSYWQWLAGAFIQATIQNVSADKYGNLTIPLPTIAEQRTIAAHLDQETTHIDALIAKVREAIDRLKELRTALISAAVTGKIDVRDAVG